MFGTVTVYPSREFERFVENRLRNLEDLEARVSAILEKVREKGDRAIRDFYREFYRLPETTPIKLGEDGLERFHNEVGQDFLDTVRVIARNVEKLAKSMMPQDVSVETSTHVAGVLWRPIPSVGVYVPGGIASYPSTAIMTIVTAKVAGVEDIKVATPPGKGTLPNKYTLATIYELGVDEVFLLGGAEAVAAFAYGTETVPRVDKIVGPGGAWFTVAKSLVSKFVGIDMLAGPTELVVVADESSNTKFVALDIAAQAEHSPDTFPVLISPSKRVVDNVSSELENIVKEAGRGEIIRRALRERGLAVIVNSVDDAVKVVNMLAPEHVHLAVSEWERIMEGIVNAGAVSIGEETPSSYGDYFSGINHVLPTNAWARFRGGLSVYDFLKPLYYTRAMCRGVEEYIQSARIITSIEKLEAHYASFEARLTSGLCGSEKTSTV